MARGAGAALLLASVLLHSGHLASSPGAPDKVNGFSRHPPYLNIAPGSKIAATATCGEDGSARPRLDLYCKLVGGPAAGVSSQTIQGQFCDHCLADDAYKAHAITNAIDGTERWWQSPPLSRGLHYNQVNVTLDFGQMLRKAHETGFLSWFRNGLLATGVGVISYMQSDTGREAAYGFFILGGVCISYGSGSYVTNLFLLRKMMLLSVPTALVSGVMVAAVALFWLCAVSLYIGRLEVEIIHDEECEDCKSKEDKSKSDK